ncbi:MAG: DNA helicase UvrD, partial [Nitrospirae bacterium]
LKGITLMGTGDFTHPEWFKELREKLQRHQNGLYVLEGQPQNDIPENCRADVYFVPSAELSCIYSKAARVRKIHLVVLMPSLEDVAIFNTRLSSIGNLSADGRPILGVDAKAVLKIALETNPEALVIPAHAWTPHFSVFGAFSGFDSLEECFEELTEYVYAIETGLSSDPPMNWRLSALDRVRLVSNSDAHSPARIGREANVFNTELSYRGIYNAIKTGQGLEATVEFFPEEGKYHYDGHRPCGVYLHPKETMKHDGRCPVCGGQLTIGVMHRVEALADRPEGYHNPAFKPFYSIVPLQEIIAEALRVGPNTKKAQEMYFKALSNLGPEFQILMNTPLDEIERTSGGMVAEGIRRVREGKVNIRPGYDGVYGEVSLFKEPEVAEIKGQGTLF